MFMCNEWNKYLFEFALQLISEDQNLFLMFTQSSSADAEINLALEWS